MAKRKQARAAMPYVQRLAEDQYVQGQLRNAASRLREAYGRVSTKRGKAAEDKKLYGNLREAATSVRKATLALQRRRSKPKRRRRRLLLLALVGSGAAVVLSERGRTKLKGTLSSEPPAGARGDDPQASQVGTTTAPEQGEVARQPTGES